MPVMNIQRYSDAFLAKTLLPLIPRSVTPNMVSWARLAAVPFIAWAFLEGRLVVALVLFALAALTDALDGAMARTRGQITELGKVLDAVADRGLIGLVGVAFIPRYFGWPLLAALAMLEIVNAFVAYRTSRKLGINVGANWAGKCKMVAQCVAFCILFVGMIARIEVAFQIAYALLIASAVFAFLQAFWYPQTREGAEQA